MANIKPRGKKRATALWLLELHLDADTLPPHARKQLKDPRFTVLTIQFNRAAPLQDIMADFRIVLTKIRYQLSKLDDLADKIKVEKAAGRARGPDMRRSVDAGIHRGERDPVAIFRMSHIVPWPSARRIAEQLGRPWTPALVRKHLRQVRKDHNLSIARLLQS